MRKKTLVVVIAMTAVGVGGWPTAKISNAQPAQKSSTLLTNFGMTVQEAWHVNPPPWYPNQNTLSGFLMSTIAEEGAGTVRLLFPWRNMELTQGNIDWSVQDIYVNTAVSRGLKIHAMFYGVPTWSNNTAWCDFWTQNCSAPPSSSDHFYNFVRAIALRYGSAISTWEFWNEPDLRTFWGGSMAQLRDFITDPGIAAVKSVSVTNRVFVSPGFSFNTNKMKIFLDKTEGDWSFIGVHIFPNGNPDPYNWSVSTMTAYHNAKQSVTNSNKNVPFFITEVAIGTEEGYTEMQLADYACKVIKSVRWDGTQGSMRAANAIVFFPWDGPSETKFNGVSYNDFSRKPVFYDIQEQLSSGGSSIPCGNSV